MFTQIAPMLALRDGNGEIDLYKAAFGAQLLWRLGSAGDIVARLSVDGAEFFLVYESPPYGTRGPSSAGFTTVRIELFVDNPMAVHRRALGAGAVEHIPVEEHTDDRSAPKPIERLLQGALVEPFGHMWLFGKILD